MKRLVSLSKTLKQSSVIEWPEGKVIQYDETFKSINEESLELKQLYSQLGEIIQPRDLIDLEERLKEVSELADRTLNIITARAKLPSLFNDFNEHYDPMATQIKKWSNLDRTGRNTYSNLTELCTELSIELADSLKLAIQIDQLIIQGQMSIELSGQVMVSDFNLVLYPY